MGKVCIDCGSNQVYEIEFRTDYAHSRNLSAVNSGIKNLDQDDLPYYLEGYYCHDCEGFCSVKESTESDNNLEIAYSHKRFPDLNEKQLDAYLDFLSRALFILNDFEVWEAENVFDEDDSEKWEKKVMKSFQTLIKEKTELEDKIYGGSK